MLKSKMTIRSIICSAVAAAALLTGANDILACTNVIITKGASRDGSNLLSYAADSHMLYGELYFRPAADWQTGSMLKVYDWDSNRYLGEIPQVDHTFKTIGNMNEYQVAIGETTWGGSEDFVDKHGAMDYGSMIYIALQRARTAREAIKIMTDLANEHGYYSEGETFSIIDKDEAWIMDLVGKGMNMRNGKNRDKGVVWVALRIPDGFICAHANQARIGKFPLDDPDNCMYAKDVISFARRKGLFFGEDEDFDFAKAYAPYDFGTVRACDARVWSAFNILCDGWFTFRDDDGNLVQKDAYDYIDYAMGYDMSGKRIPLFVRPKRKLSVKDIADVMRDHYEGTPMDMTADIGAGGNALPYRWRPMGFEWDGQKYLNERAIATQQTGFWFVAQSRGWLPDVIGGLLWFGTDDAATSYLTPIYTASEKVPECFKEGNGNLLTYSPTSSFWMNNRIANACYKMYDQMAPYVRKRIDDFETKMVSQMIPLTDNDAINLYNDIVYKLQKKMKKAEKRTVLFSGDPFAKVRKFLTEFSVDTAQKQFEDWTTLEQTLLVKFIDGNVKAQNEDGTFKHSDFSEGIPSGMTQPGYTDKWKEAVANDNGSTLKQLDTRSDTGN